MDIFLSFVLNFFLYVSFCLCASEPVHAFESSWNLIKLRVLFYTCHMVWYSIISRSFMSHSSVHLLFSRIWENRCLSVPECFTLEVSKSSVSVSIIRSGDETAAEPSNGWCDLMRFAVDFASVSPQIVYDSYDCMICMVAALRTSRMKLLPVTYTVVG